MSSGRQLLTLLLGLAGVVVALVAGFAIVGPLLAGISPRSTTPTLELTGEAISLERSATPLYLPNPTQPVAEPTPSPTRTPEPSPTSTPTPTPTITPSPSATETHTPSPTDTPTPSETAPPTATDTPTVPPTTQRPTQPPVATTRRPPRPTPTPTLMPAPLLVGPAEGQIFKFEDVIVLQWQAVGTLPANAYYVPTVYFSRYPEIWYDETEWVKGTSWTLSQHDYLPAQSDDSVFHWSVQVKRLTGVDPVTGWKVGVPLSRMSEERTLTWQKPPGPTSTIIPP